MPEDEPKAVNDHMRHFRELVERHMIYERGWTGKASAAATTAEPELVKAGFARWLNSHAGGHIVNETALAVESATRAKFATTATATQETLPIVDLNLDRADSPSLPRTRRVFGDGLDHDDVPVEPLDVKPIVEPDP